MRISKRFHCTAYMAGVIFLYSPLAVGQTTDPSADPFGRIAKPQFNQNFAPTEFFSQAERDLLQRVRGNLEADPLLSSVEGAIAVEVEVGTITLRGPVPTRDVQERMLTLVQRTVGVERVVDQLRVMNTASVTPPVAPPPAVIPRPATRPEGEVLGGYYAPPPGDHAVASFPATGARGLEAVGKPALTGSGQMAEVDRTSSSGPSGSRNVSPLASGSVDTIGRVAKPAGDYAVTTVDRGLVSLIRSRLNGHPQLPVSNDNVHLVVDNGFVIIQGWVPSRQDRRAIEATVRQLDGIQGIDNQLRVDRTAFLAAVR